MEELIVLRQQWIEKYGDPNSPEVKNRIKKAIAETEKASGIMVSGIPADKKLKNTSCQMPMLG